MLSWRCARRRTSLGGSVAVAVAALGGGRSGGFDAGTVLQHGDDRHVGIAHGGDAGRHRDVGETDDVVRLHVGDVDHELVRHVVRGGEHLDGVDRRVDDAAGGDDGLRLTLEPQLQEIHQDLLEDQL